MLQDSGFLAAALFHYPYIYTLVSCVYCLYIHSVSCLYAPRVSCLDVVNSCCIMAVGSWKIWMLHRKHRQVCFRLRPNPQTNFPFHPSHQTAEAMWTNQLRKQKSYSCRIAMKADIPFHHRILRQPFSSAWRWSLTGTASTSGTESPEIAHKHGCKSVQAYREVKFKIHSTLCIIMCHCALTGLSLGSMKKILMIISNSPQPVSVISYGGFVTTRRRSSS